ncbi:MAG: hypothetical protein V4450_00045 [Bacteroidota bacterium]
MPLTLIYEYDAGGIQFSLYGYSSGVTDKINFCFLWVGPQPVSSPDLPATWSQAGMYTFFPPLNSSDWSAFAVSVYALYQQYSGYKLRFAWSDDQASQLITGIYVNNNLVTAASNMRLSQFQLLLLSGQQPAIAVNATKDGFIITNSNSLVLNPDTYDQHSSVISLGSDLEIRVSSIEQGTLHFSVNMTTAQLSACHAGIHYYHSQTLKGDPNQPDYPYYFTFDFPVLNPATSLLMQVSLDVLSPLDPTRSSFALTGSDPIASLLVTKNGHYLSLQPTTTTVTGNNCFALVQYPRQAQETGLLCLSLQGTFVLVLENSIAKKAADNLNQLLCGISGTEHISFISKSTDYAGDLIDFIPGGSALAPVFPVLKQETANTGAAPLLTTNEFCTTSWIQVRKNIAAPTDNTVNYYYCQPADAALFKPVSSDTFLNIFDAEAGSTYDGTQTQPVPKCFPLAPFALVAEAASELPFPGSPSDFEYQILNPFRKTTIVTKMDIAARQARYQAYRKRLAIDPSLVIEYNYTTTPQGLLVQVDNSSGAQKWTNLVLAKNDDTKVPADVLLNLVDVNTTIQSAFQTNQQFLVVSKQGSLGTLTSDQQATDGDTVFHNTISIAGWPFHIGVGKNNYGDYSNVMLFKFCSGSVSDRVQNTQSWTQPEDFVGDGNAQTMLSRWLLNYCNGIDQQHSLANPAYENIYTIIHDVNWNGILALNVDIGLSDFPEDIKGLLGGIDTSRFKANHFGVEVNHITITGGVIQTPVSSSLFGLIDYTDPGYTTGQEPPGPTDVDYDFKVLKLLVLFNNSAIVDFKSKLQLTINNLFSDQVVSTGSQSGQYNTILLNGSYENHNGQNTYIFNETGDQLFTLSNNVLQVVEILKVQFSTLSTDQSSDDVRSRFSIWGNLHFASLPGMDAFSFEKLAFTNLGIRMDFSDLNPSKRNFSFDPQVVSFDIVNSTGRSKSFVYNYPLAMSGLMYGDGTQMPKDLGYLSVSSPLDGNSKTIPTSWYALSFNLNLGTLGALGSKVGLTANLVLVWGAALPNPGPADFAAAVFIHLPGTGGSSSFFSLQNVLKLSIGSIQLFVDDNTLTGTTAYLIKFTNIALKVLSKQLPSKGKIGMYLFGDPGKHGQPTDDPTQSSLGWYAAYQKDKT